MSKIEKIILIPLTIFAIIISLTSCKTEGVSYTPPDRFRVIYQDTYFYIMYDTETKVQYSVSQGGENRGNLTVLLNSQGNPLLYEGDE